MADFSNEDVITEFRANAGKVGGILADSDLVLLTTIGARTGQRRTTPVAYFRDDADIYVIASYAGSDSHPAWYRNLVANPEITVEVGSEKFAATAVEAPGEERDRLYAKAASHQPAFAQYQASTTRRIPVIVLKRH
jgi:deazaflavin-dependent oxidoreductase (nitroreductase family)